MKSKVLIPTGNNSYAAMFKSRLPQKWSLVTDNWTLVTGNCQLITDN